MDRNINFQLKLFDRKLFLFALQGILGIFLIISSASKYGPGISTDSAAYMYAAESLLEGKGFIYFGYGTPFIQWPPLFPAFLAAISALGIDVAYSGLYLNAFTFGLIIFFSGLWLYSNIRSFAFALTGSFAVLFSIPLFQVSKFLWSEPLFILFITLFFIEIGGFIKTGRPLYGILASVFAAFACLTRYTGVTVILVGLFILLLQNKKFIRRLVEMFLFGFVSGFPLFLWMVRNFRVSSTLFGARTSSRYTLMQNINFTFDTILSWFIPYGRIVSVINLRVLYVLKILAVIIIFLMIATLVAVAVRNSKNLGSGVGLSGIVPAVSFLLIYTGYLIASATSVAFDTIDNRLLVPVFVPLIMLTFAAADHVVQLLNRGAAKRICTYIIVAIAGIWLLYPFSRILLDAGNSIRNGAGVFSTEQWHDSPIINYLKENPPGGQVYSNYPDAIYALTRIPARYTPKENSLPQYGFERFRKAIKGDGRSYIVWFDKNTLNSVYNLEELRPYFTIDKILELSDGDIYVVK